MRLRRVTPDFGQGRAVVSFLEIGLLLARLLDPGRPLQVLLLLPLRGLKLRMGDLFQRRGIRSRGLQALAQFQLARRLGLRRRLFGTAALLHGQRLIHDTRSKCAGGGGS